MYTFLAKEYQPMLLIAFAAYTFVIAGCLVGPPGVKHQSHTATMLNNVVPFVFNSRLRGGQYPFILYMSDEKDSGDVIFNKHLRVSCDAVTMTTLQIPGGSTEVMFIVDCYQDNQFLEAIQEIEKHVISARITGRPKYDMLLPGNMSELLQRDDMREKLDEIATYNLTMIKRRGSGCNRLRVEFLKCVTCVENVVHTCLEGAPPVLSERAPLEARELVPSGVNFQGALLETVTMTYSPFSKATSVNGTTVIEGYNVDIIKLMAEKFNFTFTVRVSDGYGAVVNGAWNGMVGDIVRQEADFIVGPLTINSQRETAIDFTTQYFHEVVGVALKTGDSDWFYLFRPLKDTVWLVTFCGMILAAMFIVLSERIYLHGYHDNNNNKKYSKNSTKTYSKLTETHKGNRIIKPPTMSTWQLVSNSLCLGMAAFFMNNIAWLPRSNASRISMGCFWLTGMVLTASYTANLIATLASQKPDVPYKTLDDVAADDGFTLLLRESSVQRLVLEASQSGIYARLWQKVIKDPESFRAKTTTEMFNIATNGPPFRYGIVADRTSLRMRFIANNMCDMTIVPETFYPSGYGFGLPNNSPYKPYIDKYIVSLEESGLLKVLRKRQWPLDTCEIERRKNLASENPMMLRDMRAQFVVMSVGLLAATVVFTGEFILETYKRSELKIKIHKSLFELKKYLA